MSLGYKKYIEKKMKKYIEIERLQTVRIPIIPKVGLRQGMQ